MKERKKAVGDAIECGGEERESKERKGGRERKKNGKK